MSTTEEACYEESIKVLVTGFGRFQKIKVNPSWEITSQLPSSLIHRGQNITILIPPEPLASAYHSLLETVPKLLDQHNPDAILHVGLSADDKYFALEKGAERDGYDQIPDEARKVFTKGETKKIWGKSPSNLESIIDVQDAAVKLGKSIPKGVDVRTSDDVGNYVCGFVYYTSLEHLSRNGRGNKPVLFLHVPLLESKEDIEKGKSVVLALIKLLAEQTG